MADYLLEIGLEEVPAGIIQGVMAELKERLEKGLDDARIPIGGIKILGTSRRIAVSITGLKEIGEGMVQENRGPNVKAAYQDGQPTKALEGFCRGQGILVDQVEIRRDGKEEYVYGVREVPGAITKEVLAGLLEEAISKLYFPKPMRWGDNSLAFIRPIRTLVSLWNEEILPFSYGSVTAGRISRGHRFLSVGSVEISSPGTYLKDLMKGYVIADVEERRQRILEGIRKEVDGLGCQAVIQPELLEEVLFLVEYPTVFVGTFDRAYLELPKEVVMTTMVNNQKYFPVVDATGALQPYFIGVRCGDGSSLDSVIRGNQKVIKARLDDARFFFMEDRKTPLLDHLEQLDRVIYQKRLGSVGDKIKRVVSLARILGEELGYEGVDIPLAAELAKMDLASHMVYEFPELQGIMGTYYARLEGYPENVCRSISEHYLPVMAGDAVATSELGRIISLADKMDTIVSIFKAGLIPTGSQDPYALRRQALGVIRTIVENGLTISFSSLVNAAQRGVQGLPDVEQRLIEEFFKVRFRSLLEKEGLRYDLIGSILSLPFDDLHQLYLKGMALEAFSRSNQFEGVIHLLNRAGNILKKATDPHVVPRMEDLTEPEEKDLLGAYLKVREGLDRHIANKDYAKGLETLEEFASPLDAFFERLMVMDPNPMVRKNRLGILSGLIGLSSDLFDFREIVEQ